MDRTCTIGISYYDLLVNFMIWHNLALGIAVREAAFANICTRPPRMLFSTYILFGEYIKNRMKKKNHLNEKCCVCLMCICTFICVCIFYPIRCAFHIIVQYYTSFMCLSECVSIACPTCMLWIIRMRDIIKWGKGWVRVTSSHSVQSWTRTIHRMEWDGIKRQRSFVSWQTLWDIRQMIMNAVTMPAGHSKPVRHFFFMCAKPKMCFISFIQMHCSSSLWLGPLFLLAHSTTANCRRLYWCYVGSYRANT